MTQLIGRVLGGLHHRVACRLTGCQHRQGRDDVWVYPPIEHAITEKGLQEVENYIYHHQNIVAQFIATRPNMDLYLAAERKTGPQIYGLRWERTSCMLMGCGRRLWVGNLRRVRRRRIGQR